MLFVVIGVVLIALNLAGVGVFGTWNWELFGDLWKFVAAVLPRRRSGGSGPTSPGLNKRREMDAHGEEEGRPAQGKPRRARHGHARAPQGAEAQQALEPAGPASGRPQSPSSTAPRLALDAFFANLASTPRV